MKRLLGQTINIIPPFKCVGLNKQGVGISFCFRTPVDTRFIPHHMEDYYFINNLQKEKEISYIIT
jgi:hypothetical protein